MSSTYDDDDPNRIELIKRSKVFIPYYTEKCEEKLKAYLKELELRETKKANENIEKLCKKLPIQPRFLKNPIKTLGGAIANNFTNRKEQINERIKFFNEIKKYDLRKIFVEAGGYIFWSYQNQFIDVTDINDNVTVGMQKLAIDAVDRTFDFIENCESENHESCFRNIAISAFFGASKTFNVIKEGEKVKYNNSECQTASLYEGVSIIKMDVEGKWVQYKKSDLKHENFGYRLASNEEPFYSTEYKSGDWNVSNTRIGEILTINDMKPHLNDILNKINNNDPLFLQQTTKSNTDELITNTTKIKQNVENIKANTSKIGDIKSDTTEIKQDVVDIKTDIKKLMMDKSIDNGISDTCFLNQIQEKTPMWFDIKKPVKCFTGRVEILKILHNALENNQKEQVVLSQTAVITGLGGIGKTELARKYIYDYKTNYYNVIWIKSKTQQIFKESFHKVALKLNLSIKENIKKEGREKIEERERDLTSIIEHIYVYFKNTKTLIILDNVDKFDNIKHFLDVSLPPNIAKPFILITSRNQEWDVGQEETIEIIKLNEFTQEESFNFLRKFLLADNSTNEEVNQLAVILQNFPLALNQATAYINMMKKEIKMQGKHAFGIRDYLSIYNDNKSKLHKFKTNIGYERYFETIYTTWIVTLQQIVKNVDALKINEFMAYLEPDSIDVELCFSNYFEDINDMWSAIGLLHQYSMINIVNGVANIHRLVQQVIRIKLKEEKKEEEILKSALFFLRRPEDLNSIYEHNGSLWNFASYYKQLIFDNYFMYKYGGSIEHSPLHLLVLGDYVTAVENIIKCFDNNKLFDINVLNGKNYTPLQIAVDGNHLNMTTLLISKGADFQVVDENGYTLLHIAANNGHINIIKYLLNLNLIDVKSSNSFGDTPLHIAVSEGYIDILELFLSKGADVNIVTRNDCTLLHIAARNGHINIIKYLITLNLIDVDTRNKSGKTSIHLAVSGGYIDILELFISKGADVNTADEDGNTLLHIAVNNVQINIIKYLLNLNLIDVDTRNKKGHTALRVAVDKGCVKIVELFISNGADVNTVDLFGESLLHIAVINVQINFIKYLLNLIDVDTRNKYGYTALREAVWNGCVKIVELFISKGADVNTVDVYDCTLLHIAASNGHINIIKYLITLNLIDVDTRNISGKTPLHIAVWRGYIEILELFISKGADVNTVDEDGYTLLHTAAKNGHINIIKYLLNLNLIDVDTRNKSGNTPLHLAVDEGCVKIVELFISNGADVNTVDEYDNTLLHTAARKGYINIIKYLITLNLIDVDTRNKDDNTPLHMAVLRGYLEILELFLYKGADVNAVNKIGDTLLHTAAVKGNSDIIKYLLNLNLIDVDTRNKSGNTPLHLAVDKVCVKIVELFISKGADVNTVDEYDNTLLHTAAKNEHINNIKYLLNLNLIDVDTRNKDGKTALHEAVWKGYIQFVKLLIHNKADVNVVDINGFTILHFAANYGHIHITDYLLNSTLINIYAKNKHGYTPLHLAVLRGYIEIVKILTSNGDNFDFVEYGSELLHLGIKFGHIDIINYLLISVLINNRGYKNSTLLKQALGEDYKNIIKQLKSKGADINFEDEDEVKPEYRRVVPFVTSPIQNSKPNF